MESRGTSGGAGRALGRAALILVPLVTLPLLAWLERDVVPLAEPILASLLVFSAAMGALAIYRPGETEYRFLALFLFAWAVHVLGAAVPRPPLPAALWAWLANAGIGWTSVFGTLFVLRLSGVRRPRLERSLLAAAIAGTMVLAAAATAERAAFRMTALGWMTFGLLAPAVAAPALFGAFRRRGGLELEAVVAAAATILVCAAHDWLAFAGVLSRRGEIAHLAVPFVTVAAGWAMVTRFTRALGESESLAATLEDRAREKESELERSYARLGALERERILLDERERIQREMHDGIGGRLVSALAVIESGSRGAPAVGNL
ncbi:MAG: hypothetical protein ACREQJ_02265, partial [Candidatus Binatia bacterium]